MAESTTGLFRRVGKCARNPRQISHIRPELVFRGPQQKSAQNPNEISSLRAELIFRNVPGKLVQRRRHPQRLGRGIRGTRASLDAITSRVLRIPPPPVSLCLLTTRRLTFRL